MSKIKEVRMNAGFSRPDIYRLIGIPVRTLENWESGVRKPSEWEERLIVEKIESLAKERMLYMKNFEIKKNAIEIRYKDRFDIKEGVTFSDSDQDPELIETFSKLDDARKALSKYETSICISSSVIGTIYSIEEYCIEENVYDEDGDWISGGDIWGFTKMKIKVIAEDSRNVIASFDNLKDAEDYVDTYDGDEEICLEF